MNQLPEVTGKQPTTIIRNVRQLAATLKIPLAQLHIPDPPTAYCDIHGDLSDSMILRKDCVAKKCPHLSYTRIIIRYVGE
jgi:hypothetical protein